METKEKPESVVARHDCAEVMDLIHYFAKIRGTVAVHSKYLPDVLALVAQGKVISRSAQMIDGILRVSWVEGFCQ